MPTFTSLPGFRDFFPEDYFLRAHIVHAWRETARRYGFEEYDGPPLESLELYTEKSGQEIVNQLYNFEDKGGRAVALRHARQLAQGGTVLVTGSFHTVGDALAALGLAPFGVDPHEVPAGAGGSAAKLAFE